MMLNMSNQYERYRHCNQMESSNSNNNNNNNSSSSTSNNFNSNQLPTTSINALGSGSGSGSCSSPISPNAFAAAVAADRAERESIHSGQFMVSHFEAEEAQDDDDSEIKMLDPEDPSLLKPDEPNVCTEVQLYVPRKIYRDQMDDGSPSLVTSHLEIETSLTKLFKCMNLAYSQKLTSPKWNHFKGVRLRWKDKIRLNNVIWRCWHMQFILKRRTPVCQFASPLDADVHSNPQSVVLEGKYWKRQLAVIKAEYRKWRRNFKNTAAGYLIHDTKSEFDFLEWSPLNDKNLMLTEDWTSDTLFSAINVPFPFPDPREIARGAGIADFIQPSLGPLQPNLDDIDLTFVELLQNSRLPPVPEEVTDDMLKTVEYSFSAIMGPEQMDSSNIMDVTASNSTDISQSLVNGEDTNMIELNPSLNSMQFTDLEQQFVTRETTNIAVSSSDALMSDQQTLNLLPGSPTKRNQMKSFPVAIDCTNSQLCGFSTGKSVIKGRVSKSNQRPFRREPHNYDKAQPTLHQTNIYQQMLAEQQQQQHQNQLSQLNTIQQHLQQQQYQHQNTQLPQSFQQQQTQQPNLQYSQRFAPTPLLNNNNFSTTVTPINLLNMSPSCTSPKSYPISQMQTTTNASTQRQEPTSSLMLNVKIEPPSPDVLSMFNLTASQADDFSMMGNASSLYKPYTKKSIVGSSCLNVKSSESNQLVAYLQEQQQQQQQHLHTQSLPLPLTSSLSPQEQQIQQQIQSAQQSQQQMMPKEMFRSNSLPLNVSLQKLDGRLGLDHFAVPKYHMKNNKSRSRSNSIQQHGGQPANVNSSNNTLQVTQQLQSATSDPMLNSTLAQLLTKHSKLSSGSKQHSSSTSAISSSLNVQSIRSAAATSIVLPSAVNAAVSDTLCQPNSSPSSVSNLSPSAPSAIGAVGYQLSHQSPQSIHQLIPKKSNSLPVPTTPLLLHSPPGNKMMSYPPPSGALASISNNLSLSPESFHDQDSPLSPSHSLKYPRDTHRRAGHIHAEQKRRYNIKNGFDMLHSLIPQLQQSPNAKLSKAAMLQKGADHIKQLRSERNALKEKMEALRKERDSLNNSLTHLHSMLPANGAPVTRQRTEHVKQLYEQYVRMRTMSNWKFWILGLILEPLLSSYTQCVSSASLDELRRTVFLWVDQHCSLIDLRPAVSNKLRYLSMTTDILSDPPSTLQEEVVKAINNVAGQHPNLSGS